MRYFLPVIFFFLLTDIGIAQEDSLKVHRGPKPCEVHLTDGTFYKGIIEKQNDSLIFLRGSLGVLMLIPKKKVTEVVSSRYALKDSVQKTKGPSIGKRYYVTTSNATLFKSRQVFMSSSYLLFYSVNYAFDPHFSLGISTTAIGVPLGIQAKGNFSIAQQIHIGFECAAGSLMYLGPKTYGTGGVGKITFGNEVKNYTLFVGFADLEYWVQSRRGGRGRPPVPGNYYMRFTSPFAGVALLSPMGSKTCFVGEAFAFPNISIYTASASIRTTGREKVSFVFGIQAIGNVSVGASSAFVFPYLGFSAAF